MRPREVTAISAGNAYRLDVATETHSWVLDEAEDAGGTNAGPTPVESFLGALVSCLTISFQFQARRRGVPIERIEGWVAANQNKFVEEISIELQVWSPAPEADVRALMERAERGCFVKAVIKPEVRVSVDLVIYPAAGEAPAASGR